MKILLLKGLLVALLGCLSFTNSFAETGGHQKLYICVSGNGVNIDFSLPSDIHISTGHIGSSIETTADFVSIGGVMLNFTVTIDSSFSATKVTVVTTNTHHRSEYPIVNGMVQVQVFVPIHETNDQYIYISVN
ncbi:MAG: hypothetical protein LUI85_00455 [Bacteroides sp.]|nr:hypothetical protein [Bacteroides sp.]